jgi:phage shock protein A
MGRLSTLIKAKISKLLDRAENPGETLDYAYEKQLEQIRVIRKGIVDVVTARSASRVTRRRLSSRRRSSTSRHGRRSGSGATTSLAWRSSASS